MSAADRFNLRTIVQTMFPWLKGFRLGAAKGLSIKTESSKLHLEGDAGDPGVVRVGDFAIRLFLDINTGILHGSTTPDPGPYVWVPVMSSFVPPTPLDPGTAFTLSQGSSKVTCG